MDTTCITAHFRSITSLRYEGQESQHIGVERGPLTSGCLCVPINVSKLIRRTHNVSRRFRTTGRLHSQPFGCDIKFFGCKAERLDMSGLCANSEKKACVLVP